MEDDVLFFFICPKAKNTCFSIFLNHVLDKIANKNNIKLIFLILFQLFCVMFGLGPLNYLLFLNTHTALYQPNNWIQSPIVDFCSSLLSASSSVAAEIKFQKSNSAFGINGLESKSLIFDVIWEVWMFALWSRRSVSFEYLYDEEWHKLLCLQWLWGVLA